MKTNFTLKLVRFFALSFVLALVTLDVYAQTSHNVAVTSNVFTPKELTVTAGDEVVWTNTQGNHNVNGDKATFPNNPASFGNGVGSGWTYKFVFDVAGTYDYQCNPHVGIGMVGKIIVNPKPATGPFNLTVNFTGMTPHVGQTIWLAVIDQATKMEIGRVKKTAAVTFSIDVPGIEPGKSYNVDFYADHSKNGVYNAPPTDHAWRMQLNNVTGNSTLNFAHNTNFTDIAWKNKLTVHFTGMTPHLGQKFTLLLKQADNGLYKDTVVVASVPAAIFDVVSYKIKPGTSYKIDFYSDHNKNGIYDAPPADHAWRLPLDNVLGDTIVNFAHNTSFTDILIPNPATGPFNLTVNFTGMTPHVGQTIWLAVIDQATKMEIGRVKKTAAVTFSIDVPGIETGKSYNVDFYADHNKNGVYNAPPTDHAWRMQLNNVTGNSTLNFAHNTNFTDIGWKNKLTVHFAGMTPHLGQKLTLFLKQADNGLYKDTVVVASVPAAIFDVVSYKIKPGTSYKIDFYADHNKNGIYNAPPADHAWRLPLDNVLGDTIVNFIHNTSFTDIFNVTAINSLVENTGNIQLYPNPAKQYIELKIPRDQASVRLLKVYSVSGALIDQKVLSGKAEAFRYDISRFKNGIYFMEINSGHQLNRLKFIKQ